MYFRYAPLVLLLLTGLSLQNKYIKANYSVSKYAKDSWESAIWNREGEDWQHNKVHRVWNDNDMRATFKAETQTKGSKIVQTRFKPEDKWINSWLLTKAAKSKNGKGWHIHLPSDPTLVWTRDATWAAAITAGNPNPAVTLEKLKVNNPLQYWAHKGGEQMWTHEQHEKTMAVGFLDVAHCYGSDFGHAVVRRQTRAMQQIWHWQTGEGCTTCDETQVNLVEMEGWTFKNMGAIKKSFVCNSLHSARNFARYWIRNSHGEQTVGTWDGQSFNIRDMRLTPETKVGPYEALPDEGNYTFSEGIQVSYRNDNLIIHLAGTVNLKKGVNVSDEMVGRVVDALYNIVHKSKEGCEKGGKGFKKEETREVIEVTLQAFRKPVMEKVIDKEYNAIPEGTV